MPSGRARRLAAAVLPVAVVLYAWATLEVGASPGAFLALAGAAVLPALPVHRGARVGVAAVVLASVSIVLVRAAGAPVGEIAVRGVSDAYAIAPPFVAATHAELTVIVALLATSFALGAAVVAGDRPLVSAIIVSAGVGIPATINPSRNTIAMGALALLAILWSIAVSAAPDRASFGPGVAVVSIVTIAAVVIAGIGARPSVAALDWRNWDFFGDSDASRTVALVWSSNYEGIDFPPRKTTVLRVTAPRRALYWRATTLDTFASDRWGEALLSSAPDPQGRPLPPDPLLPAGAADPRGWVKQEIEVRAFVDDHVIAAAQPVAIEARSEGTPRFRSGGVIVQPGDAPRLKRYTVWSYAPTPTPAALVASPARYPVALARYLDVGRPVVPPFGTPDRVATVEALFDDFRFQALLPYRALWRDARSLTAEARSPFEATIAIERWLRSEGGFVYDERPPPPDGLPPLADFEQRTKSGYCQQFAGTMALMLRYLGIPARVAVGFRSGTWEDGGWTVTDHDAHAWVEVWFAGHGWLPFDPTPGRGTLSATHTIASDSADAIAALGGRFVGSSALGRSPTRRGTPTAVAEASESGVGWLPFAPIAIVGAALLLLAAAKRVRRFRRASVRDPRGRASAARAELAAYMCDQGVPVTTSTPISVLATELRALGVGSDAFARAFSRARYGPPAIAAVAADETAAELRKLISVLRDRLGHARRVRGFLAVRSLRAAADQPSSRSASSVA